MIWTLALLPAATGLMIWTLGSASRVALAVLGGAVMVGIAVLSALEPAPASFVWAPDFPLLLDLTDTARAVALTVSVIGLAVLIFAAFHEAQTGLARLMGLLLIFIGAMQLVVSAADFVSLLIGWEVMGACSWALIGHRWREAQAARSAGFAFVTTRLGDLGLFLAAFACYAGTGGLTFSDLADLDGGLLAVAAFGILIAAAAKAGQAPFTAWLFRAMDGPTSVSALLHSSTMVAAGAYLLIRLQPVLANASGFSTGAVMIGLFTALAAGAAALVQTHAKKLLAGSSSAQLGLMIAAVGAGYPGVAAVHLVVHGAFKAPLFFAAGLAKEVRGGFDLESLRLGRALPLVAVLAGVAALGLAGLPPAGGAWSKEKIVAALGHASTGYALAAMLAGTLSAAYAARWWMLAFAPGEATRARVSRAAVAALGLLAALSLAATALWIGPLRSPVLGWAGVDPVSGPLWELALSVTLVIAGLAVGVALARRPVAALQHDGLGAASFAFAGDAADRTARAAAWIDDRILDAPRRAVVAAADRLPRLIETVEAVLVDGSGERSSTGAVGWSTTAVRGLSSFGARTGEAAANLAAAASARLSGRGAQGASRLQTGMTHDYFILLAAVAFLGAALLIFGG